MKYVLDTNIVLYYLKDQLLEPIPDGDYQVSVITGMELLSYPNLKADEEMEIHEFLSSVEIVGLTEHVQESAIELRKKYRLSMADAIIAATAYAEQSCLITNDQELLSVDELSCKSLELNI